MTIVIISGNLIKKKEQAAMLVSRYVQVEVAKFISSQVDAYRSRRSLRKGNFAERDIAVIYFLGIQ